MQHEVLVCMIVKTYDTVAIAVAVAFIALIDVVPLKQILWI